MWIIVAFVVGVAFGVFLEWLSWTRCRRQHTKVGTPSASHNRQSTPFVKCDSCNNKAFYHFCVNHFTDGE